MARKKRNAAKHLTTLCKIGTVAHNRPFKKRELLEYGGFGSSVTYLKRKGWLKKVPGGLYPTAQGWRAVELACAFRRGKK